MVASSGSLSLWGDPTHALRVRWEVGLFRDMDQALGVRAALILLCRGEGVVSGTSASASRVSPLRVFLSHLCGIPGQELDTTQGPGPREQSAALDQGMGGRF